MKVRPLLAVLAVLALAWPPSPAPAEGGKETPGVPPPKRRPDGGPVFVPPDAPGKPAGEKPAPPEAPKPTEIGTLVAALDTWPSAEARSAADRLAVLWAEARGPVMAALAARSPEGRAAAGAAAAIRRAGDRECLPALLDSLREPRNSRWCGEILETVTALDPVGAKDRLLPLLGSPSSLIVERVARVLRPLLGPGDVPRLREHLVSRQAATRRAALGMAAELDREAMRESLVEFLGDPSPEVAMAAAVSLGHRAGEEGVAALNALVRGDDPRRSAWAVVALLLESEEAGGPPLEEATVASLIGTRGLRSGDPLQRCAAAMALADLGYHRPDPLVDPILEAEVVPALMEVVAGMRFFPDLMVMKPLALSRMHRLCAGTDAIRTAPDWVSWWERNAAGFVARRALVSLPAAVRGDLRLRVEGPEAGGAGPAVYALRAAEAPPAGGAGGRFVALTPADAGRLAEAVEASGLLALPPAAGTPEEPVPLEIGVEAGRRGRTVRFPAGQGIPEGVRSLLRTLESVRESHLWQRYWSRRSFPTFEAFVEAESPFWSGDAGAPEREARLLRLAIGALRDLEDEGDRLAALRRAAASPSLREALTPEQALTLASFAAVGGSLSPTGEAALGVLAKAGRTEGLSPLRARLDGARDPAERQALAGLLEETLAAAPLDAVLAASGGGAGLGVRAAAIRSLGSRDGEDARVLSEVRRATADAEPPVRAAGYVALGTLRAKGALEVLEYAAEKDPDAEARAGALEGLGLHGGPEVVAVLGRALQSSEPWLRAAAVRGLAATREPEGLTFVLTAMTSDPDPSVRAEADRAVRAVGGERAREALRAVATDRRRAASTRALAVEGLGKLGAEASLADLRALMADPEDEVADAAAFALAWIRDGDSVPRVLAALREGREPARALRCIELLSLESFRTVRDRAEATALYTGWYEVSRERGPRGWLAEALRVRGHADPGLAEFESGAVPRAAVPSLLKAFRDAPWYLRRAANLELQRIGGTSFGEVDPWTPEAGALAVGEAWAAWWDRERGVRR